MGTPRLRVHRSVTWEKVNELQAELRAVRAQAKADLMAERDLRIAAEENATRFHAMLIAERVARI